MKRQRGSLTGMIVAFLAGLTLAAGAVEAAPGRPLTVVVLGDSLISDVDRAVMSVHRRLGRKYHLLGDQ